MGVLAFILIGGKLCSSNSGPFCRLCLRQFLRQALRLPPPTEQVAVTTVPMTVRVTIDRTRHCGSGHREQGDRALEACNREGPSEIVSGLPKVQAVSSATVTSRRS